MTQQSIDPVIKIDAKRFPLLLIVLFGAGIAVLALCKWLIAITGIGLFDGLFIAAAVMMLLGLIRLTTLRYVYVVDGESVKIMKAYGDKINTMAEVRPCDLLGVAKYDAAVDYKAKYRSVTWMANKKKVSAVLFYKQTGAAHALMFAPNEEILAAMRELKDAHAAKNEKENA